MRFLEEALPGPPAPGPHFGAGLIIFQAYGSGFSSFPLRMLFSENRHDARSVIV